MRQYVVDCESLRKRYNIEEATGPSAAPAEQPAAIIDCVAEVERFWLDAATAEHQPPDEPLGESPGEQMWDDSMSDNDLEPEELGRRMYKRGEAPPSPHPENNDIRHGYDQEAHAAAAAAASSSTQAVPSSAADGTVAEEQ